MSDTTARTDDQVVSSEDLHDLLEREREKNRQLAERLHNEEAARQRVERERDTAVGSATSEFDRRWAAEEQKLDAQLAQATGEAEALEQQIAALNAEGSYAEAAKKSRLMARAEATVAHVEQQKQQITEAKAWQAEQARQAQAQADAQRQAQPRRRGGVDLSTYTPREREWIDDHPKFLTDRVFRARVSVGHEQATAAGYERDSEEYFATLNAAIRGADREPEPRRRAAAEEMGQEDDGEQYYNPPPRRREEPAMPVTRRPPTGGNGARRPYSLTAEEREFADTSLPQLPINDYMEDGVLKPGRYRRYAELQARLRAEGRLT